MLSRHRCIKGHSARPSSGLKEDRWLGHLFGRPFLEAFFGHLQEPLSGYKCLLVACQWLISGLLVTY